MPSGTIGSATGADNVTGVAADYSTVQSWENSIDGDDQVGTIIYIEDFADTWESNFIGSYTGALLTAHTDAALDAPTYASASTRARLPNKTELWAEGTTIERIGHLSAGYGILTGGEVNTVVRRCFLRSVGLCVGDSGGAGGSVTYSNLALVGTGLPIYYGLAGPVDFYFCSCTGTRMTNDGATANAWGVISQVDDDTNFVGTWGGDFNVSYDNTAPGTSSTKYARSSTGWFEDETATAEDFTLQAGKQGWWAANKDAIDPSGWPADVATDIAGTTRAAPIDPGVWQTPGGSEETYTPSPAEATGTAATASQALVAATPSAPATAPAPTLALACSAATGSATAGTARQAALAGIATAAATAGPPTLAATDGSADAVSMAPPPGLALIAALALATATAGAELTHTPAAAEATMVAIDAARLAMVPGAAATVGTGTFGAMAFVPTTAPATFTAEFHQVELARIGPFRLRELARASVREQHRTWLREEDR